ncbi:MAG: imidazole glycerol phosphate synthase subunit HisH [Porticoccaceae bacterium]|nr:imidazole glycerol phosphate synthase subunit HisH [Porticoccaceae bacterium]
MSGSKSHIAVIDYGMGNLHSVSKALEHVCAHAQVSITSDPTVVADADRVVFPGVGAIGDCMTEIQRLKIDEVLNQAIIDKPVLGICVGMQALLQHSEESNGVDCLGILPGKVKLFESTMPDSENEQFKVPHMGWNNVEQSIDHPLWYGIEQNSLFYFVHSFYAAIEHNPYVAAYCQYGVTFAAALSHRNLFAVQFHPEKSADKGLQLLRNFTRWTV